ncbi:MAG: hypothetical protein KF773_08915 [Deltaproteobacteria bacterium]|nr:hypothetical protein [Deltaproteobacteria bacterium]
MARGPHHEAARHRRDRSREHRPRRLVRRRHLLGPPRARLEAVLRSRRARRRRLPLLQRLPLPTLPTYFLVGDKNPLHALARDLRTYLESCKQPVTWDLVARGDHEREAQALDKKKALTILDWAAAHARKPSP